MKKIIYTLFVLLIISGIAYGMIHFQGVTNKLEREITFAATHLRLAFLHGKSETYYGSTVAFANNTSEQGIPVLLYHGIVDEPDRFNLTQERFAEHMRALHTAGYQTITMSDFGLFLAGEPVDLPDKPFVLTFDDGRKDSYIGADPVLALYDFHATMFLPSVLYDPNRKTSTYYLSHDELRDMANSPRWEIQSHAIQEAGGYVPIDSMGRQGNLLSNRAWLAREGRLETPQEYADRVRHELLTSREEIEQNIGAQPIAFSYPFGDYGQQSENYRAAQDIILSEVGDHYPLAFRQVWPFDSGYSFNYKSEDARILRRIEPSPFASGSDMLRLLAGGSTKGLPYSDQFIDNKGWKSTWGRFTIKNSVGLLQATEVTTGAFIFLDGSFPWGNYRFTVSGTQTPGSRVTLVGHYIDQVNFISCVFDESGIWIESYRDGVQVVRKGVSHHSGYESATYGLRVSRETFGCEINDNIVSAVQMDIDHISKRGGVGIKVWSPAIGTAEYAIKRAYVDPLAAGDQRAEALEAFLALSQESVLGVTKIPTIAQIDTKQQSGAQRIPASTPAELSSSSVGERVIAEPTAVPETPIALFNEDGTPTPFIEQFTSELSWRMDGGTMEYAEGGFRLQTGNDSNAATYYLLGSRDWNNYSLSTDVRYVSGTTYSVIARRTSDRDYIECAFSRGTKSGYATLSVVEGGKRIKLFQSPRALLLYGEGDYANATIGISVNGNDVTCSFNGYPLIEYEHLRLPPTGGVALRQWDATKGKMTAVVSSIRVQPIQ